MTEEKEILSYEEMAIRYNAASKAESKAKYIKKTYRNALMAYMKEMKTEADEVTNLSNDLYDIEISYTIPTYNPKPDPALLLIEGVSQAIIDKCTPAKVDEEGNLIESERITVKVKEKKNAS